MPGVNNINPEKYPVTLNGHIITGVGEGTFITVEPATDNATMWEGAQGDVIFVHSNSRAVSITIRLSPTSPSNIFLHRMADAKTGGPLEIKDMNEGRTVVRSSYAVILNRPSLGRGAEVTVNEWVIGAANAQLEIP